MSTHFAKLYLKLSDLYHWVILAGQRFEKSIYHFQIKGLVECLGWMRCYLQLIQFCFQDLLCLIQVIRSFWANLKSPHLLWRFEWLHHWFHCFAHHLDRWLLWSNWWVDRPIFGSQTKATIPTPKEPTTALHMPAFVFEALPQVYLVAPI